MSERNRFRDNNDGTVTDTQTGLVWAREDSWQSEAKWVTWDEALEYAKHRCRLNFGGLSDWRLPSPEEAGTLYVADKINRDKYGKEIHLDPVFPPGPQATFWIYDYVGSEAYFFDLRTGETGLKFKSVAGRMAARPVCGKRLEADFDPFDEGSDGLANPGSASTG
ncbi:MAG: DUF1566 domain-containing protein [Nitrospinales bacterium]